MGKADLHVHTSFSDGMASAREVLDWVETATDLDVVAVTDHDDVRGALKAREVWARGSYRFDFVPGVEITTIEGHLLGLFVEEPVPNLCPVEKAIEAVHRQGGICVAAHPLNPLTRSLGAKELRRLAKAADGTYLDGIEVANCSPGSRWRRAKAIALNDAELGLARVGGSDAHFTDFVGGAYTEFEGTTAAELRAAIAARTTEAKDGIRPGYWQIGPRRLVHQSWRGLMTTPRRMGWGPTTRSFVQRIFR
jgi:predicted metal-dependent phosphoesterase TrpH